MTILSLGFSISSNERASNVVAVKHETTLDSTHLRVEPR